VTGSGFLALPLCLHVGKRGLSRQNPLLMIFEDAHWADPSSLELFSRIVDNFYGTRIISHPIDL
jgi:hypothetical protein